MPSSPTPVFYCQRPPFPGRSRKQPRRKPATGRSRARTRDRCRTEPTAFDGRSDYKAFIDAGIPAGGLFCGAEDTKTAREAAIYGGTAGVAYDECYHAACDDITNLNKSALDQLADGAAHATLVFAQTTSAVNGTNTASNTASSKMEYQGPHAKR